MASKKDIIKLFRLTASLMEIHGENEFKTRVFTNAVFNLEKHEGELIGLTEEELGKIDGIGKSMASNIAQVLTRGTFDKLEELKGSTPEGLLDIIDIKGLGAKKVRMLWKDLGISSLEEIKEACERNIIASIKGFGDRTQENILREVNYKLSNKYKLLYADAEVLAEEWLEKLKKILPEARIEIAGEVRRKMEIVEEVTFVLETSDVSKATSKLTSTGGIEFDKSKSGPFNLRGTFTSNGVKVQIVLAGKEDFINKLLLHTGSERHLSLTNSSGINLFSLLIDKKFKSEDEAYETLSIPYVLPELREGLLEQELGERPLKLIEFGDLKGSIHNHSTYSDGKNTLREMAEKCIELGYEYLGISDHSKSAFYAGGLQEYAVKKQHEEIDQLNEALAPFKIFKGIESDILNDGFLDYEQDVLASFDFIVASIHSNLNMEMAKATSRLITAIKNPYTTFLGHSTGRLLLRREGYPIDHKAVIDACAENGVIIEINANPWRLDLDWRWVNYAIKAGVMLSINPDAHETKGFEDMYYGILVGRKGGLTKEMNFNSLGKDEVEKYFKMRKEKINESAV